MDLDAQEAIHIISYYSYRPKEIDHRVESRVKCTQQQHLGKISKTLSQVVPSTIEAGKHLLFCLGPRCKVVSFDDGHDIKVAQ